VYKGVLDGSSRAVFNGKVFVRPGANGTDAQQTNRNLLLSNDAHVDTKPQLEIFADDVRCTHGAAIGQLDDEMIFYLNSRGMSDDTARRLLTYGFAGEVLEAMGVAEVRATLDDVLAARLAARRS
jgi:Fe-S cluster assembly protein SufD